jgi:putative glycosyltransferase (TIGR04372 family)
VPTVLALMLHRTLGDFVEQAIFARTVADRMGAHLVCVYRDDRPYKAPILFLIECDTVAVPDGVVIPVDAFDTAAYPPVPMTRSWHAAGRSRPDLILSPSMCDRRGLPGLGTLARFAVPREHAVEIPRKPVIVHWREPGYEYRPDSAQREVPVEYVQAVINCLRRRGETIIRIGHPNMSPVEGVIDMAAAPFRSQVYAVSKAKMFVEISPSGPAALALAYGVPWLRLNANGPWGPVHEHSLIVLQHLDKDGAELTSQEILDLGEFDEWSAYINGQSWRRITIVEAERAIDKMYARLHRPEANDNPPLAVPFSRTGPRAEIVGWNGQAVEAA